MSYSLALLGIRENLWGNRPSFCIIWAPLELISWFWMVLSRFSLEYSLCGWPSFASLLAYISKLLYSSDIYLIFSSSLCVNSFCVSCVYGWGNCWSLSQPSCFACSSSYSSSRHSLSKWRAAWFNAMLKLKVLLKLNRFELFEALWELWRPPVCKA